LFALSQKASFAIFVNWHVPIIAGGSFKACFQSAPLKARRSGTAGRTLMAVGAISMEIHIPIRAAHPVHEVLTRRHGPAHFRDETHGRRAGRESLAPVLPGARGLSVAQIGQHVVVTGIARPSTMVTM
jgi:hypothetical protein